MRGRQASASIKGKFENTGFLDREVTGSLGIEARNTMYGIWISGIDQL